VKPLTDVQRDALTELANLGTGRAAAALSRMVAEPVQLSVPALDILSLAEAVRVLEDRERAASLVAVGQGFQGTLSGRALLIFPEAKSLELVRAVVGQEPSLEEIADLEQEALAEVGNVILNGFLGTIANLLRRSLDASLPNVKRGPGSAIFGISAGQGQDPDSPVLFLQIDFTIRSRDIRGYIALLMNFPSLETLEALVEEFVARLVGQQTTSP
jgi:chemotaxis protein CheC